MTCNYYEYKIMSENLLYAGPMTDAKLTDATEQIRQYLVNGGAGNVLKALGIGIKSVTREATLIPTETVSKRFVWIKGLRRGRELDRNEIVSIGMFLKEGAFYGKCTIPVL